MTELDCRRVSQANTLCTRPLLSVIQSKIRKSCAFQKKKRKRQQMFSKIQIYLTVIQATHAMHTDAAPYHHRCWLLRLLLEQLGWSFSFLTHRTWAESKHGLIWPQNMSTVFLSSSDEDDCIIQLKVTCLCAAVDCWVTMVFQGTLQPTG